MKWPSAGCSSERFANPRRGNPEKTRPRLRSHRSSPRRQKRRTFAEEAARMGDDEARERRRVLIVDDDLDFLEVAEAELVAYGFEVARARGGLRAVFLSTQ